jgi:hypothetical protein
VDRDQREFANLVYNRCLEECDETDGLALTPFFMSIRADAGAGAEVIQGLVDLRTVNHSTIAVVELMNTVGRLDPIHGEPAAVVTQIRSAIQGMPGHRLSKPDAETLGRAAVLAGILSRTQGYASDDRLRALHNCVLFLQALKLGFTVLTRNTKDYDFPAANGAGRACLVLPPEPQGGPKTVKAGPIGSGNRIPHRAMLVRSSGRGYEIKLRRATISKSYGCHHIKLIEDVANDRCFLFQICPQLTGGYFTVRGWFWRSMRLAPVAIIVAACAIGSSAFAGPFSLTGDSRWIALASRQNVDEAIGVARAYRWRFPTVRVMQATNGWYAIVAGPQRIPNARAFKESLVQAGEVPNDAVITKGDGYVSEVWKFNPVTPFAQTKYDGKKQLTLSYGDLALRVSSLPGEDGNGRFPVLAGFQKGGAAFTARLEKSSNEEPNAEVAIVRLDGTSVGPQVVFSSFWGGAHCCTVTKFATNVGGGWHVVTGETLDGDGGYSFEDIEGDGTLELLSVDNSFLYAFAPYAMSSAPMQISKLVGDRLLNVTANPDMRTFVRQELYRLEYVADREQDVWRSNGFLAAWVATKAIVGEFDDAWGRMLTLYDRSSDWPLTECTVAKVDGTCPAGKERSIDFPRALRSHLEEQGYIPKYPRPPLPENR